MSTIVVRQVNRVLVSAPGPQGPPGDGSGSLPDITTPGTFVFATVTTDAKGRVTAASSGTDVASEATQQEILDEVDAIATTLADITVNGVVGPTVNVEPD